ncbi:MAG: AAA family ATPase [Limnohabitans sp.]|nr:AAA family ATPase [Limnohabitans sp.]
MLTKIQINSVATFKSQTTLETDKKINLIYGLNGSGKSTICRLLRNPDKAEYAQCQVIGSQGSKIYVFNEDFIRENFYESSLIKGIFSLSKQNKDAEQAIALAMSQRTTLLAEKEAIESKKLENSEQIQKEISSIHEKTFAIKRNHSGGDRVLEFCLEGVMGKKEKLFDQLFATKKTSEKPDYSVRQLQDEARLLTGENSTRDETLLPTFLMTAHSVETDPIFGKAVVGAHNSNFGDFINRLKSSDWVRSGITYLDLEAKKPNDCPFCQQPTIDDHFVSEMQSYFDKTYDEQIEKLKEIELQYEVAIASLPQNSEFQTSQFYELEIGTKCQHLAATLRQNILLIQKKRGTPSLPVTLQSTKIIVEELNALIASINLKIADHKKKIANKGAAKDEIKNRFWQLMRWEYDQSISFYESLQSQLKTVNDDYSTKLSKVNASLLEIGASISEAQKATVNIDVAIKNINFELVNLGILDFQIKKHNDHLYQLERTGGGTNSFQSLSEGEKMIIALLYFCELCEGKESADEQPKDRIVVLDDPISSMSHIFVFNVGRLLMSRFFKEDKIKQVFVFTHSLYFFYELTDIKKERRQETQALFRVSKSTLGSAVNAMKYEEIQNDYQSYWQLVNDVGTHPALVANCMRNIVEYFFGFVEKKDFNNVFQKPELSSNKLQAFNRYMNRESHSFGQNVFDLKEFNYQDFHEGLRLVFDTCGYGEHYKQMAKIK